MRTIFGHRPFAIAAVVGCCLATPALACDLNSATDLTCGTSFNPANPLSPNNPANLARNPASPYFSEPVYADGIFSLFEQNPRIIYPAGPPQTCRLGLDCPAGVANSPSATLYGLRPVAQALPSRPVTPTRRHHHRRHQAAR